MPRTQTRAKRTARNSEKHDLYELAVQDVEHEAGYLERLFKRMRGRRAMSLKEDFCGTASLCCEWVRRHKTHCAVGVDYHGPTLAWGRKHRLSKLEESEASRVVLIKDDVRKVRRPRVDMVAALNFSYFIFKTRDSLREYFKNARASLNRDGLFLMDAYGGSEAQEVLEERRRCKGFTYVWEHADFNPITNETVCHIHFEFPDGSKQRKAFTYEWRLWSLAEIQELMLEAGFSKVEVHWEGTDQDTGEGNGVFRKTTRGEAIESWVAYIIGMP